jgi:hypothetical protein
MAKEIALIIPLLLIPFVLATPEKKKEKEPKQLKQRVVDLRPLARRIRDYYEKKYEYTHKYYK